ncbi:hypothetical protein SYNTR_1784 [Candidatus Syntrophocurvum alkaliphilum]|uniref:ATPase n=1 Tax=Candidatus Syntrophocurvum alkaliphilum TaxID=2293317 RepID=A0A6I6DMY8_9FIRM|nr:hypothetical protein [Candidatus Syntrophocurvum alkaliphilum]QGU00378.1 hypothetical protein SYNTR_1784 [Candidatus Syntrophocurvum alkaliphilum]
MSNNRGRIGYVFTSSNTIQGYYTFIPELIAELTKVYILKGPAGSGKSTFIRLLGESLAEQGYEIEFWISAVDPLSPDGVYIPQLEVAVINGSLPVPIDPKYPGAKEEMIYLGDYWDRDAIKHNKKAITELVDSMINLNNEAAVLMKKAGEIKEEIKRATSNSLNLEKIEVLLKQLNDKIFSNRSKEKHYFASAVTAEGVVNYVDEISAYCKKRFIFKGPPGSCKSTIINELAQEAKKRGCLLEYYHCGFQVESIVMLILRDMQIALIDAGDIEISINPWDSIIDMSEYLDDDYDPFVVETQTSEALRNYEAQIKNGQIKLEGANNALKELKKIYSVAMDFERLDKKRNKIREELVAETKPEKF